MSKNILENFENLNNLKKINLLNLNKNKMRDFFCSIGEKSFRADQIMIWMYQKNFENFNDMTNINKNLKEKLKKIVEIKAPKIFKEIKSLDGTIKWMMDIGNKQLIETVYIPEKKRSTICISSQAGCTLGCKFCATSYQGFNRNLKVCEIIGQIWMAIKTLKKNGNYKKPISNIVIMGMGEPLLNFNNIVDSIKIMIDNKGFSLSKRHITLSTAGIAPALNKLGKYVNVNLALSLHASNDKIRDSIMPINKKYNISQVLESVKNYLNETKKNIFTIEYVMLNNINDYNKNAYELVKLLKNIPCKINLIPWNSFSGALYSCSNNIRIHKFANILTNHGFIATIRKNRGQDINAACGQLTGLILNRIKLYN